MTADPTQAAVALMTAATTGADPDLIEELAYDTHATLGLALMCGRLLTALSEESGTPESRILQSYASSCVGEWAWHD